MLKSSLNLLIIFITGSEFRKTFYDVFGINEEQVQVETRRGISITDNTQYTLQTNSENDKCLDKVLIRETRV